MRGPFSSRQLLAGALGAVIVVLAACGGDDGEAGPDPAQLAPADVPVFVDLVVRPEGEIATGAASGLEQLTGNSDPGGFVVDQLDDLLAQQDSGVTYEQDIAPWLGERAGLFFTDLGDDAQPDFSLIFTVTDEAAAQETVDKLNEADTSSRTEETYEGVSYSLDDEDSAVGFIDEFLVIGSMATFEAAVDASAGESLADTDAYTELIDLAVADRLGSAYIDTPALIDELEASGTLSGEAVDPVLGQLGALGEAPLLASAGLSADELSFELAGAASDAGAQLGSALLEQLPADSWLALAGGDVGGAISAAAAGLAGGAELGGAGDVAGALEGGLGIDLAEDFGWIGDAAAFVTGSSVLSIGAGIVADTTDVAASAASLQKLSDSLASGGNVDVTPTEGEVGFRLSLPDLPIGAEIVQRGDQVLAAGGSTTVEDLASPETGGLTGSEDFQRAQDALGEDFEVGAFLNFVELVRLIDELPNATTDPGLADVRNVLDTLDYVVFGARRDGDTAVLGGVLGLGEGGGSDGESSEATTATISP